MLQGLLQWVLSDVIRTLGTFGVIGLGILLIFGRFSPVLIIGIAAGIWVMFNSEMLMGLMQS